MRSRQATVVYLDVEYGDEHGQTEICFFGGSGTILLQVVKSEVKAADDNLMVKL